MTALPGFQLKSASGIGTLLLALAASVNQLPAQTFPLRIPEGSASKPAPRATIRVDAGYRGPVHSPAYPIYPSYPTYPGYSPYHRYPVYRRYPAYPVAFTYLPAILMSDGTVFADFGYGYLPVHRPCGPAVPAPGYYQHPYHHPAPAQRTAAEENLPSVRARREAAARIAARSACFMNHQGSLVVVR